LAPGSRGACRRTQRSTGRDLESPTLLRESVEPRAVDRIGWKDWRTLMRVYAKATKRRERLSGAHLRAYDRAIEWHEWAQTKSWSVLAAAEQQKTPPERGFREADEGTQTLDLLHGNPPRHANSGPAAAWLSQTGEGR
jgi:hypothetical protein